MRLLAVVALVLATSAVTARADGFDALVRKGASWTYEVTDEGHKPTGTKVTVKVASVHRTGPYAVVVLDVKPKDTAGARLPTLIIGPEGVHSAPFFFGDALTDAERYGLHNVKTVYEDHFIPYATIPMLATGTKHVQLDRFGDDDREYDVHVAITHPRGKPWHVAWTGEYTIPEDGEVEKLDLAIDYDPGVGIAMICDEEKFCLRLVP
jgi:hypothetical protein